MKKADFYIFNNGLMTTNTMSGSDQRAFNWSRIFSAEHYHVNVFTSAAGAKRFIALGLKVYVTGATYLKSNIGLFLVYLSRAVNSCLLQFKIKFTDGDVAYSSSDLLADVIPALFMKLRNKHSKLVVGMHLVAPNPFKGFNKLYTAGIKLPSLSNLYYFIFQRAVLLVLKRMASLVLVSNQSDRIFLLRKGFSPERILVTYGACDALFGDSVLNASKTYDAVYVGRLHSQKGFPDLLQVWKMVVEKLPNAKLEVIGEDINARDFMLFVKKNKLEQNIQFLGFLGGAQKYSYIKSSKVLILPSYYESFGIVALEAMACAVPVVAYDLPVFREIYTKGMVRAPIGDINCMARNTIELISDDAKRMALSKDAWELSRQFSWEKTASDILRVIGD